MNIDDEIREQKIIKEIKNRKRNKKIIAYLVLIIISISIIFIVIKLSKTSSRSQVIYPNYIEIGLSSNKVNVETPVNITVQLAKRNGNETIISKIPNEPIYIYVYNGEKKLYGNCTTEDGGNCTLEYIPKKTGIYTVYAEMKSNKTVSGSTAIDSIASQPDITPPSIS